MHFFRSSVSEGSSARSNTACRERNWEGNTHRLTAHPATHTPVRKYASTTHTAMQMCRFSSSHTHSKKVHADAKARRTITTQYHFCLNVHCLNFNRERQTETERERKPCRPSFNNEASEDKEAQRDGEKRREKRMNDRARRTRMVPLQKG